MKSIVVCSFHKNSGYCAKGKYCEFSHDLTTGSKTQCQSFSATGTCKFGSRCSFLHMKVQRAASTLQLSSQPPKPPTRQTQKSSLEASQSIQQLSVGESRNDPFDMNSLWDFPEENEKRFSYASMAIIGSSVIEELPFDTPVSDDHLSTKTDHTNSAIQVSSSSMKSVVCQFYLSGNCRYGDYCRYSHSILFPSNGQGDMDEIDQQTSTKSDIDAWNKTSDDCNSSSSFDAKEAIADYLTPNAECGICLATPEDGRYGLLSHCDCVFCLSCIRGWRKDGIAVARSNSQVRLCPLCRSQSYFVCPSQVHLRGRGKDIAVDAYKQSMRSIPCRHYQRDGSCDFGSSCFYSHLNKDGSLADMSSTAPHALINSSLETEYRSYSRDLRDFL